MTNEEIKEKMELLVSAEKAQKEKVTAAADAVEKARRKYGRENSRLAEMQAEVSRYEGYLLNNTMQKYGIDSFEEFEKFLARNIPEPDPSMEPGEETAGTVK